jgi:NADH-quinone oxidoreductase subunit N
MGAWTLIVPECLLLAGALVALFADVLFRARERAGAWAGALSAALAAAVSLAAGSGALFGGQFAVDGAAQLARTATLVLTAAFLVWLAGAGLKRGRVREFTALVLFASFGALLMAAARDWIVLLLALEAATMPAYVLMGFDRGDDRSLEGALKYFLLSMVASLLFLYGMSFVIGMSGSTLLAASRLQPGAVGTVAVAFVFAGLLAKLSAAPFQWWSPDAYAGAPSAAVAFVSSVPKIAGLFAFARVAAVLAPQAPATGPLLAAAAVASMLVGNLAAYPQTDVRRLMAYSGVAHAGYLLVGLAAGTVAGTQAAVFYAVAYAVPSMGVMLVAAQHGETLDALRGLASRRPWVAWATALMLVSLVGVPPLAGFVGKLYLFTAAMRSGLVWLSVLAVVMSAVSAGFYLRVVRAMFFGAGEGAAAEARGPLASTLVVAACALAVVAIGIGSSPLLAAISFAR